ncbi:MAG: hypothetical protein KF773_00140 [Deltaproteobacteria bacterium]|nr:hypothetical protein [Deltaproteobacteria bacterium]
MTRWLVPLLAVVALGACDKGKDADKGKGGDKKSKGDDGGRDRAEAQLMLNKIGKSAKTAYVENAEFPKGSAGLTPATACCSTPDKKCKPDPSAWSGSPVWKALDISLDEPHVFQYSYEGDGKTFVAKAVGDPGCTGTPITLRVEGSAAGGNPQITLSE